MGWESFVNFIIDNGVAIITAALIGIAGSMLVNVANNRSMYKEVKSKIEEMKSNLGDILNRGSITAQNDRISGEIKVGNDKADKSFEKLDDGVTTLLINDAAKIEKLSGLAENKRLMLENVEALVIDYTNMQVQVSELRRENSELMSSNEQLRNELSELRREVENQLGYEMEM